MKRANRFLLSKPTDLGSLALEEFTVGQPGPGEVLVRMRAASLNFRDLLLTSGAYPAAALPEQLVPLSDGAGEIVAVGEGVERWRIGDRVCGIFTQSWLAGRKKPADDSQELGGPIDGVLTQFRIFNEQGLVAVPEHLSFEEAATLPCAAVTAWNALFCGRPVRAGETVLILGTGGVSCFALQFAKMAGAHVIATSSSDQKLDRARALGASETINYKTQPEWQDEVRRLTDGRGVDHVVEVGGPGTLQRSLASLAMNGQAHLIGVLTQGEINPLAILGAAINVRGILVGSREMFEDMNRAIVHHQLKPVIDSTYAFEEAPSAYRSLQKAGHVGKIVITI